MHADPGTLWWSGVGEPKIISTILSRLLLSFFSQLPLRTKTQTSSSALRATSHSTSALYRSLSPDGRHLIPTVASRAGPSQGRLFGELARATVQTPERSLERELCYRKASLKAINSMIINNNIHLIMTKITTSSLVQSDMKSENNNYLLIRHRALASFENYLIYWHIHNNNNNPKTNGYTCFLQTLYNGVNCYLHKLLADLQNV